VPVGCLRAGRSASGGPAPVDPAPTDQDPSRRPHGRSTPRSLPPHSGRPAAPAVPRPQRRHVTRQRHQAHRRSLIHRPKQAPSWAAPPDPTSASAPLEATGDRGAPCCPALLAPFLACRARSLYTPVDQVCARQVAHGRLTCVPAKRQATGPGSSGLLRVREAGGQPGTAPAEADSQLA